MLFVPGFGCGAFHFESNVCGLAELGFRVFAIDKLGLGDSVVSDGPSAAQITLTIWRDQIVTFIDEVLQGERVFLAGNSLGGLLAACVCAERPDLTAGAILLNAAPFWATVPPAVVNLWWSRLTQADIVRQTLRLVYHDERAVDDALVDAILAPTARPHAQTVFSSVLTSKPPDFDRAVRAAFADAAVPLALVNGARDPWVGPIWAMRLKAAVPAATVYEIDPAGHCPHDECPDTVHFLVAEWIRAVIQQRPPPAFGSPIAPLSLGDVNVVTKNGPSSVLQRLAARTGVFGALLLATIESIL